MNNTSIFIASCFLALGLSAGLTLTAQPKPGAIQLNQLGFYPGAPKVAIVTANVTTEASFYLLNAQTKDTVYKGKLGKPVQSTNSSLITRAADFSSFRKTGRYVVAVPGLENSYAFSIKKNIQQQVAIASLKGYYFQRCSMPLEADYAGKWDRPAGHPDTAVLVHPAAASEKRVSGTVISTPGGWYDAGDYNKYIVNSGISMGTLLSAYEDFQPYFKQLKTTIPESNNAIPDILDEALYNLRWMLTMQDPNDGGVYNKCTNADFDGMVMPGVTKAPRYVVQKGTAATLDFAAVMAQASRVFNAFNKELPGLSDSCIKAAGLAWQWAQQNQAMAYDQDKNNNTFKPAINTGGYGDGYFNDEFFWAAAELFCSTGDAAYYKTIAANQGTPMSLPSWSNVQLLGHFSLIRHIKKLPPIALADVLRNGTRLIQFAYSLMSGMSASAFKTVMGKSVHDFNWGSNSNAANQGIALINVYQLTKNKRYLDAALSNLDYLVGRNATGYSFVTGVGTRTPMHPHHRQSEADQVVAPVPGLLVGGPNPGKEDKCSYQFNEPETSYEDVNCSYASNEIAINWNAPLVYLANAIEALQVAAGYVTRKY